MFPCQLQTFALWPPHTCQDMIEVLDTKKIQFILGNEYQGNIIKQSMTEHPQTNPLTPKNTEIKKSDPLFLMLPSAKLTLQNHMGVSSKIMLLT